MIMTVMMAVAVMRMVIMTGVMVRGIVVVSAHVILPCVGITSCRWCAPR